MSKFELGEHVRILTEREDGMNGYGRVDKILDEGYWIKNMNMPYAGTISGLYKAYQLEKVK